ncbi:MAG: Glutamyl-tRNA(Gln) amidotransferase subunit A [Phycisphaerae bacterium]|nr:Glutamyl-tRNA(Gln) amidotransferase subunit A [Phycisphaerae bacterium]
MSDLTYLTALQLRDAIAAGEASAEQAACAHLDRIGRLNPTLGAFLDVWEAPAIAQARAIDARRAAGRPIGPLGGVPVALKDNLCTRHGATTCGSKMLADFHAPYDAHVVERIAAADGVILGKTNMDEFAMGSSTEHSAVGRTVNPWATHCVPGGSSGGSAVAVAARLAPVALGSDTGGSIRQPGSFCGVVALKPTYGRVSRYGLVAFASSLDQIGPFGRTVADAAWLLRAVAGRDPRDSTSVDAPVPDYLATLDQPIEGLRVGIVREFFGEGLDSQVKSAVDVALSALQGRGAKLVEVSLPHATRYAIAAYYIVATAEASSNLARYDGVHYGHRAASPADCLDVYLSSRAEALGEEVKRRIMLGTYALSSGYYDAYYLRALKVRRLIRNDFDAAFKQVDVVAGPTSPTTAFALGARSDDPLAMYLCDVYTTACNLAGLPGINVPCGFDDAGKPIGLQMMAQAFEEEKLLRAARMYEQTADWSARAPAL